MAALLGASGVDLTPELAIDDLGEQIDFVMNFVLSQKNKAHVIDLLTMRQEASTDLAITLSDARARPRARVRTRRSDRPILAGNHPAVQGAILADLWVANKAFTPIRQKILPPNFFKIFCSLPSLMRRPPLADPGAPY